MVKTMYRINTNGLRIFNSKKEKFYLEKHKSKNISVLICLNHQLTYLSLGLCLLATCRVSTAQAEPVGDGKTDTKITQNGNQFDINVGDDGGTISGDNLFHSFEEFGLTPGQIANFMSNPNIRNILGRVTGGDASVINGLIQVTGGDSNLFLINPAGIIFGKDASLNLPASFTATTANGIQVGDFWFDALGSNNYSNLVGDVNGFAFATDETGSIVNAGNLAVSQGETINLIGGLVINTGTLEAPEGNINITAVPGKQLVEISPEGSLLSLALPTDTENALSNSASTVTPLDLPDLLTGGNLQQATGVEIAANGTIKLTGSENEMPNELGTAIISGDIIPTTSNNDLEIGNLGVVGNKIFLQNSSDSIILEINGSTTLNAKEQISFNDNSIVGSDGREFNSRYSFNRLTAIVDPPGNQTGTIQVFGDIEADNRKFSSDQITLENKNGDIIIGSQGKPLNISTIIETDEPSGTTGADINIKAPNGTVELFGSISIDEIDVLSERQSNINIDARRFRAIEPYDFNGRMLSDGQTVITTTETANLAIIYRSSTNDEESPLFRLEPNIRLSLEFINEKLDVQNKRELIADENRDISHNINIILREDDNFVIGTEATPNISTEQNISGIVDDTFIINNEQANGSVTSGTSLFNGSFGSGLLDNNPDFPNDDNQIAQEELEVELVAINPVDETQRASFCNELNIASIAGSDKIKATCDGQALAFVFTKPTDEDGNPITVTEELFPELLTGKEIIDTNQNTSWHFWNLNPNSQFELIPKQLFVRKI